MATNPLSFTLTPGMAPAAPLMRMLARFDRPKVEAFAEISIALLDMIDGDPDREDEDEDGQCSEDEISTNLRVLSSGGPGCEISDPDYAVDDKPCDEDFDQEHDYRHAPAAVSFNRAD